MAETERRLGPIDVLVVNHGIGSAHERLIWEQDPEVWRETMRVNLDAPFELSRLVVGGMVERGAGSVVYTSSTAGQVAERAGSAYTASKHGLLGLMRAVAQDAGPFGVRSNAVLPGWVRTEMAERSARAEAERRGITTDRGVGRAGRLVSAGPRADAARGGGGDRLSVRRRRLRGQRRGGHGRARQHLVSSTLTGPFR